MSGRSPLPGQMCQQPCEGHPEGGSLYSAGGPYYFYHTGPPPPPFPVPYRMPEPHQQLPPPPPLLSTLTYPQYGPQTSTAVSTVPKGENPREIRNKAEKKRRDRLNQSISELAAIVPPVVCSDRRVDKTAVLRLTAHFLRTHYYIFGVAVAIGQVDRALNPGAVDALMKILGGFLLTTTYKGLIVVVSRNVKEYLGYDELDLLGKSILNITHEDDRSMLKEELMPKSVDLGPNGELLLPDDPEARTKVNQLLGNERRHFVVRFKKMTPRSEPDQYVSCQVEGSMRMADHADRGYTRPCQMLRRARARADTPYSSGNDVVFIGIVRPIAETFLCERRIEAYRMEYRTRHAVDGEIVQCEQKIALVTGYMIHEVQGLNAMNFMHRDDVRWVVVALREMYDRQRLMGESCYRLMTKNGQFVYMRTRGYLEVDESSRAVTSFVCTNEVVDEAEGKVLIQLMKNKFKMLIDSNEPPAPEDPDDDTDSGGVPVEDPRQLEKVILHLVTDLPSPEPTAGPSGSSPGPSTPSTHLNIIPPERERIISSIGKFYDVIKNFAHTDKAPEAQESNSSGVQGDQDGVNVDRAGSGTETQGVALKRKMDNDTLEQNAFEDTFQKHSHDENMQYEDLGRFNISDQVLGAVQLRRRDPSTSVVHKRQASDPEVDENGYSYKRKVFEDAEPEYAQVNEPANVSTFETFGGFDCAFDENGLEDITIMQSLLEWGPDPDVVLPEILLDDPFQDLFGDIENNRQNEAAASGSGF